MNPAGRVSACAPPPARITAKNHGDVAGGYENCVKP